MAASSSLDHLSNRMKLEWFSKLNTEMVPMKNFRRTSIIGTIGMFFSSWRVVARVRPGKFLPGTGANVQCSLSGPKTNHTEKINALRRGMTCSMDKH